MPAPATSDSGSAAPQGQPRTEGDLVTTALDLLVFAPLGFVMRAGTLVPDLVTSGRDEWKRRSTVARFIGKMVVDGGRRSLSDKLTRENSDSSFAAPATAAAPDVAPPPTSNSPHPAQTPPKPGTKRSRSAKATAVAKVAPDAPIDEADELPISGYDTLPAPSIIELLAGLDSAGLAAVQRYESSHRGRRTILARVAQLDSSG